MTTAFKTENTINLTLTADELAELTALEKSFEACGIAFKDDGSINIRRTTFQIMRSLSQLQDRKLPDLKAWGNTAFTPEEVEAYLFHMGIEEVSLSQIKSAVSWWVARGIVRRSGNGWLCANNS